MGTFFSAATVPNPPPTPLPPASPPVMVLDFYVDGEHDVNIRFTPGSETLSVWDTDNSYFDLAGGNDTVTMSGFGENTFILGRDDDFFNGWDAFDNQLVWGGFGNDFILGGYGDDDFHGDDGNDVLDGDLGNDSLSGGAGDDILVGGYGNDVVDGGDGDDVLVAGIGDTLFGGNGSDTFDFGTLDGERGRLTIHADLGNDFFDFGGLAEDTRIYFAGNNILIHNPDLGTSVVVQVVPTYDDGWSIKG